MSPNRTHRHPTFRYIGLHEYFLTICTYERQRAFADSAFAADAVVQLFRSAAAFHFEIIAYRLMPDQVHIVAQGARDDSNLRSFVQSWNTTMGFRWRRTHAGPLWQTGYHDHVLRAEDARLGVARYVLLNPVRAGLVENAEDYPFSGSGRYTITQILEAAEDWKPSW